jgi:selenocysteine lyase/cysteine desulfurase
LNNNFAYAHTLSGHGQIAKDLIQISRVSVAKLLKTNAENIVFNLGTTQGLQQIAYAIDFLFEKKFNVLATNFDHTSLIGP